MTHKSITKILYNNEQIKTRINEIAEWINLNYADSKLIVFIGVLKGSLIFLTELIQKVKIDCMIDFVIAKSYFGGTESTGELKIITDIDTIIENKDVILVDDILDSGITLAKIRDYLKLRKPNSLKIITLFDKKSKRKYNIEADISGFEVPDAFLVGYGLDYQDKYRNWPFVAIFDPNKN
ncbi:hypoxanthine-guanine phosphoribosyltransferases [Mesomycoplasma dispar]|uniref:Hypoxanthine phosphoribosyltransferase n=1 Tax=Mesomycoplasma dispar TaxID=86660 RepID=A0AAJ5TD23_9BACT|nr:hypoxanthine phosphoribosyltransferase [Mesomycoplasma dispar]AJR12417.1 hypoxanthine phosphoribosyltransferase [Mesomycoplasma dispar]VEU62519.1 hypoxanthine-guanine phosphoribosyltransferases [Mesomycoplasma dispar]